jgi:hypothetical protein
LLSEEVILPQREEDPMRRLPLVAGVAFVVVGCSQAQMPPPAPTHVTAHHVQAPDSAVAQSLMVQGGASMRAERWAEAERRFASAYERAVESQRGEAAFFRGLALYRQGEAIARLNPMGEKEAARRARQHFEDARVALQHAEHPMREQVLKAIEQYLAPPVEIADGRA